MIYVLQYIRRGFPTLQRMAPSSWQVTALPARPCSAAVAQLDFHRTERMARRYVETGRLQEVLVDWNLLPDAVRTGRQEFPPSLLTTNLVSHPADSGTLSIDKSRCLPSGETCTCVQPSRVFRIGVRTQYPLSARWTILGYSLYPASFAAMDVSKILVAPSGSYTTNAACAAHSAPATAAIASLGESGHGAGRVRDRGGTGRSDRGAARTEEKCGNGCIRSRPSGIPRSSVDASIRAPLAEMRPLTGRLPDLSRSHELNGG